MNTYLFDSIEAHENLRPLSFTRPLADFRCGILTIKEKWEKHFPSEYKYYPVEYLREKFGDVTDEEEALFIAGNLLPDNELVEHIRNLNSGEALIFEQDFSKNNEDIFSNVLAFRGSLRRFKAGDYKAVFADFTPDLLVYVFDIFLRNPEEINKDYALLTSGRVSQPVPDCVRTLENRTHPHHKDIFIEEGAVVECATINIQNGPVYIGKDAFLMEGACVRGPFALCEASEVRMGAKIYEGTTIGPHCKVGGEVSNTVFFGFSNKAHDGYLGNAVIGEWCNIGAGANASNLKNDYTLIRVWNYKSETFQKTDLQFCGLIMGDHSKIGVNCMINTATVMGVGVNLHGGGFPRNYLPNFSEGSAVTGFEKTSFDKFHGIASRMMSRRDKELNSVDEKMLRYIYES